MWVIWLEHAYQLLTMGATPRSGARRNDESDCPSLETGGLVDDFTRRAQERTGGGGAYSNLTDKGTWYHGIEQGTELTVLVFEQGIWITPTQTDESK